MAKIYDRYNALLTLLCVLLLPIVATADDNEAGEVTEIELTAEQEADLPSYVRELRAQGCTYLGSFTLASCGIAWTERITIGAGLPAVSFRFDGKIGFLEQFTPLEIGINAARYVSYNRTTRSVRKYAFRASLGLGIARDPDDSGISFAAYLAPIGFRLDDFMIGAGIGYTATDKLESENRNWSVVIPVTYNLLGVGGGASKSQDKEK
jgi:hypothetical protein